MHERRKLRLRCKNAGSYMFEGPGFIRGHLCLAREIVKNDPETHGSVTAQYELMASQGGPIHARSYTLLCSVQGRKCAVWTTYICCVETTHMLESQDVLCADHSCAVWRPYIWIGLDCNGLEWNQWNAMDWIAMDWKGMEWNRMKWKTGTRYQDRVEYNRFVLCYKVFCNFMSLYVNIS